MKKVLKSFIGLIVLMFMVININIQKVSAKEIDTTFGVSPSKINNIVIDSGKSATIRFKVGNKTIPLDNNGDKYKFNIHVSVENEENSKTDISDWIKLDKTDVEVSPKEVKEVYAQLSIPKDSRKKPYKLYIKFTREIIQGSGTNGNIIENTIKVPIFINVGTKEDFDNLKLEYDINNMDILINNLSINSQDNQSTISKEVLKNLKELITINPKSISNTFKGIKYRPYYKINKDSLILDLQNDIYVPFNKVITNDKNKLNDWNYVYLDNSLKDKDVSYVVNNDSDITLFIDENNSIVINTLPSNKDYILKQINSFIEDKSSKKTVQFFLDKLKLPINKTYEYNNLYVLYNIDNKGEKLITPKSETTLIKDNYMEIGKSVSEIITIPSQSSDNLISKFELSSELSNGDYQAKGTVLVENNKTEKTIDFSIKNIRNSIFYITLGSYITGVLVFIILIIFIVKFTIKKLKKN